MRLRTANLLLALYVGIGLGCLVWPGYAVAGARTRPFVFGLPFSLAWHIGWVVLTCCVVALYHRAVGEKNDS